MMLTPPQVGECIFSTPNLERNIENGEGSRSLVKQSQQVDA